MSRTTARLNYFQIFGIYVAVFDCINSTLHFFRLFRIRNIILHFILQRRIRITFKPNSTYGIICHITNNPIGRKQLRNSRKRIFCNRLFRSENLVFFDGNIKLIQPTNYFNIVQEKFFGNFNKFCKYRFAFQKCLGQKKLQIRTFFGKKHRQNSRQLIALTEKNVSIQFFNFAFFFQRCAKSQV